MAGGAAPTLALQYRQRGEHCVSVCSLDRGTRAALPTGSAHRLMRRLHGGRAAPDAALGHAIGARLRHGMSGPPLERRRDVGTEGKSNRAVVRDGQARGRPRGMIVWSDIIAARAHIGDHVRRKPVLSLSPGTFDGPHRALCFKLEAVRSGGRSSRAACSAACCRSRPCPRPGSPPRRAAITRSPSRYVAQVASSQKRRSGARRPGCGGTPDRGRAGRRGGARGAARWRLRRGTGRKSRGRAVRRQHGPGGAPRLTGERTGSFPAVSRWVGRAAQQAVQPALALPRLRAGRKCPRHRLRGRGLEYEPHSCVALARKTVRMIAAGIAALPAAAMPAGSAAILRASLATNSSGSAAGGARFTQPQHSASQASNRSAPRMAFSARPRVMRVPRYWMPPPWMIPISA